MAPRCTWNTTTKGYEPLEPKGRKYMSPVFLVDPNFTKRMKDTDIVEFRGHDHGGYKEPKVKQ